MKKILLVAVVSMMTTMNVLAQIPYIQCEWDDVNKKIVKTTEHTNYEQTHYISEHAEGTPLKDWVVVNQTITIKENLKCLGTVHLILCDGVTLTVEKGLAVNAGYGELIIHSQSYGDLMGKFIAKSTNEGQAGIGGATSTYSGQIEIQGGDITAYGAKYGSGIGCSNDRDGLEITIKGGHIVAYGGMYGAGIGGGGIKNNDIDGSIEGNDITIYDGYVEAHGGDSGAGIGGGLNVNGCSGLNIYGGTVKAYGGSRGAGIGSGEQKQNKRHGGVLTVFGGNVEAHGGAYGAGIGGGQDASGATVTVNGGTVWASSGTDAAGIGSGESATETIHGGSLIVYGGEVFADGSDWGAGIGGGEDADGAQVEIYGGKVTAWAGDDAGNKNGSAIGSEVGDNHRGSLKFGDNMMVHAGQTPSSTSLFTEPERTPACFFRPYASVEPCTHKGSTYTVSGKTDTDTHSLQCRYCKGISEERHHFENGECTVCHVSGDISTVSIYLPEKVGDSYTDGHYGSTPTTQQQLITNSTFELPAPPVTYLPSGVTFAGWHVGTPEGITSYWVGDDEQILEAGSLYTVTADISLTARYKGLDISLADNADNSDILWQNDGKKAQRVTLTDRMLYKNGEWNTLCLPFNVPISGSVLDGDGVDVRTLSSAAFTDGTLTLNFTGAGDVSVIEAGKPYIIKWNSGTDLTDADLVFSNVTIRNTMNDVECDLGDGNGITFCGIYHSISFTEDDRNTLLLGENNKLDYPQSGAAIGAQHACFVLSGFTAGDPSDA